jgi:hypothetical protein
VSQKLVPIYRMHQPTLVSPCVLGDLCSTCARHRLCHAGRLCGGCRRGLAYQCDRQAEAQPAFHVTLREALQLVHYGLANFIHRNSALQLTFDRLTHLRDLSCHVDQYVILDYVCGEFRPRLAVNQGWRIPADVTMISKLQADLYAQSMFRFI